MRTVSVFKVLYDVDGVNMKRIFPTKQRMAFDIHEKFKNDSRIVCVIVFGSAASDKCHQHSDIDIMVRLRDEDVNTGNKNEISEEIQNICDWNADIIWYDRISRDDRIYNSVLKGVRIV